MTTFYLVRHGQSEWNVKKLIQGQVDTHLTILGQEQAKEIAKVLKNIRFDAIFSSDLLRAKQTAEIIAAERQITLRTSELLRERNYGMLQGKHDKKVYEDPLLGKLLQEFERLSAQQRWKTRMVPDAESDEELASRLLTILRELSVAHPEEKILVVSHSGPMRILLMHLGIFQKGELGHHAFDNTGYIVIRSDGVEFFVKEIHGLQKQYA